LTEEEYWDLDDYQLAAFVELHNERVEVEHQRVRLIEAQDRNATFRAGMIVATIANVHRDPEKQKDPWGPGDFFPSLNPSPGEDVPSPDEEHEPNWRGLFTFLERESRKRSK